MCYRENARRAGAIIDFSTMVAIFVCDHFTLSQENLGREICMKSQTLANGPQRQQCRELLRSTRPIERSQQTPGPRANPTIRNPTQPYKAVQPYATTNNRTSNPPNPTPICPHRLPPPNQPTLPSSAQPNPPPTQTNPYRREIIVGISLLRSFAPDPVLLC